MGKSPKERKQDQRNRDKIKADAIQAALNRASELEFWQMQRERDAKLFDWIAVDALHESILDTLHWMRTFKEQDENDVDFLGLDEGEAHLDQMVRDLGVVRLGYIFRQNFDGCPWAREYWKDKQLLAKICAENTATGAFAKYGRLAAIPDQRYLDWKKEHGAKPALDIGRYFEVIGPRQIGRYR